MTYSKKDDIFLLKKSIFIAFMYMYFNETKESEQNKQQSVQEPN